MKTIPMTFSQLENLYKKCKNMRDNKEPSIKLTTRWITKLDKDDIELYKNNPIVEAYGKVGRIDGVNIEVDIYK